MFSFTLIFKFVIQETNTINLLFCKTMCDDNQIFRQNSCILIKTRTSGLTGNRFPHFSIVIVRVLEKLYDFIFSILRV